MLSLLFQTIQRFVIHIRAGVVFALPALALLFALRGKMEDPAAGVLQLGGLLVAFLLAAALQCHAAAGHLLRLSPAPLRVFHALRWRKTHTDFFLYVVLGAALAAALAAYFYDTAFVLNDYAEALRQKQADASDRQSGLLAAAAFGARATSALFLFLTLLVWRRVCRVGVRIVAHADGKHLRAEDAMALTNERGGAMFALSLLFFAAASGVYFYAAGWLPAGGRVWLLVACYFVLSQLHLALWAQVYFEISQKHHIGKLVV